MANDDYIFKKASDLQKPFSKQISGINLLQSVVNTKTWFPSKQYSNITLQKQKLHGLQA